mgnify:CR=1 FL=1
MKKQFAKQSKTAHITRNKHQTDYLIGELDTFARLLSYGFSENNWDAAASVYKDLCGYLSQKERDVLGDIWREAYSHRNEDKIHKGVAEIKARLFTS